MSTLTVRETNDILDNAEMVANETLGNNKNQPVEVHHHHHDSGHWWLPLMVPSNHTTINNYNGSDGSSRRSNDDDGPGRLLIGIAFSVVALTTSYFIGKDFGRISDTSEEMQRADNDLWTLGHCDPNEKNRRITRIVTEEKQLLSSKRTDALVGLALKTTMVATAALGIGGAVVAAPALMVSGAVGGVAAGAGMLVKVGYNHASHRHERQAERILREVKEARHSV